jgi:hypothetical protein
MLKEYGGLGVPGLRELNLCLIGLWIGRYDREIKIRYGNFSLILNTKSGTPMSCLTKM